MVEEISAAGGVRLREGEKLQMSLKFGKFRTQAGWRPGEIILTNQRLFYLEGEGQGIVSRSAALEDVTNARMTGKPRDKDILLLVAATVVLAIAIGIGMGMAFPGGISTVTRPVLFAGFAIAMGGVLWWWIDGGNAVVELNAGEATINAKVSESMGKPVSEFLKSLAELKSSFSITETAAQSTVPSSDTNS